MLLTLREQLVATFNETRALTSRKYVAAQAIVIRNWSKLFQTFWSHSSVFALEKQPENLNFHTVFTSKRPFGGYFQFNACSYFQKKCSWTWCSDAKLIKDISKLFGRAPLFLLLKIFGVFWPLKQLCVSNFCGVYTLSENNMLVRCVSWYQIRFRHLKFYAFTALVFFRKIA